MAYQLNELNYRTVSAAAGVCESAHRRYTLVDLPGACSLSAASPEEALARELREELDIGVRVGRVRDAVYYRYPDRDVLVLFYGCAIIEGEPVALECNAIAWATPEALPGYDFAGADLAFVRRNYSAQL